MSNFYKFTRRRLPHVQIGGSWYFITFNSKRGPLAEAARRIVMDTIAYDRGKRYELFMAVVMPDHVHMLIRPREKEPGKYFDLSEILNLIKGVSSRKINKLLGKSGQLWWDESFDTIIHDQAEFQARVEYMLKNPVNKGAGGEGGTIRFFFKVSIQEWMLPVKSACDPAAAREIVVRSQEWLRPVCKKPLPLFGLAKQKCNFCIAL